MPQMFKIMALSAWLIVSAALVSQSARAQGGYPPVDEAWNSTHYASLAQRIESEGLELPTLSGKATKPVFERMVDFDNIPMRMGLNRELSVTLRYQKLEPVLQPLHKLVILYSNEAKKGKPYATELARLMVYESKAAGTLLEISDSLLSALPKDKYYKYQVANVDQIKTDARKIYVGLVQCMTETSVYSKPDMLKLIGAALSDLPSYQAIFTDQDRQDHTQKLTKQIAATTDQQLKTALTELRDAIEHRRVRT